MDYGHQQYIDTLNSRKTIVLRALERLERRVTDIPYNQQKWFKWVRQCQDDEENTRENEKKKIKREAALFKRRTKDAQSRMRALRAREDQKRQEAYLDEAYNARLSEEQEAEWDPIEDVIEDERGNYVDLIKHILFMTEAVEDTDAASKPAAASDGSIKEPTSTPLPQSKASKKSKKSKSTPVANGPDAKLPDKAAHDTKSQVRARLRAGVKLKYAEGMHVAGSIDNPRETHEKTAPVPDDEIDQLLQDMGEIKHLLFCRLLLAHAPVLPAAIRASSVDEFLDDKEVTDTDLRDIALKLDAPSLQDVRDACADLGRGNEDDEVYSDSAEETEVDKSAERMKKMGLSGAKPPHRMPDNWAPDRERKITEEKRQRQQEADHLPSFLGEQEPDKAKTVIDFGTFEDEVNSSSKKIRVKVCRRFIYNYPSEKALSRGGWLQFCLIAKNSDLHDAIKLCRHWDEFFHLNILANFQYFPAANWLIWKGDRLRQQLLQLGFIPYMRFELAEEMSENFQTGSRGRDRRAHMISEARNFMCANVKRNDPVSRRFLQYLSMQSNKVIVLIRDAKTSKILCQPPEDQLWLNRHKSGMGRASKNEWTIRAKVGPEFFEKMERMREWHFGFNDYYDVYVWDFEPGQSFSQLYSTVSTALFKANSFSSIKDAYNSAAPILKTITHDRETFRTRDIKPGEDETSLWDVLQRGKPIVFDPNHQPTQFRDGDGQATEELPKRLFYTEADKLEDALLFPEELAGAQKALYSGKNSDLESFADGGIAWDRFVQDLDTDEDTSESESSNGVDEDDDGDEEVDGDDDDDGDDDQWEDESDGDKMSETSPRQSKRHDRPQHERLPPQLCRKHEWEVQPYLSKEEKQDLGILEGWNPPHEYGSNVEAEFWTFMDREKSRVFKRSWYAADLSPGSQEKRHEADVILKQMIDYIDTRTDKFKYFHTLRFLDVHPDSNRRTARDAQDARAMAMLFFPSDFTSSEHGILHKDSLILNQAERTRNPPVRRPCTSNKFQPRSFWEEWDAWKSNHGRYDEYPEEWDCAIRPIIAKLYKAGVLGNAYLAPGDIPGRATAAKNPTGERDIYIDLRQMQEDIVWPKDVQHPPSKEHIRLSARKFAKEHPNARFAALRLWSAAHFWPLMVGHDRRQFQAFTDALDRAWEWNFVPKDMPYSETSMHHSARLRLKPFQKQLGERVVLRRDLFLVMGIDEADLLKYTTATIFAIQTEPWRLEVDLWRSFVNVDMEFLEGLREEWLD
ncbi:hypothetical protein ACLMJK_002756 [Lecanora helva]